MTSPTHQAVILAAGMGSRLRPLTDFRPKPLVEVLGTPILFNALDCLGKVGVEDVTIVVGYRKDAIQYACGGGFRGLGIRYVESPNFDRTGSAHSLWLARDRLAAGDCYVLEADVFFERAALERLRDQRPGNAAAVAPFEQSMEGTVVRLGENGLIEEFKLNHVTSCSEPGEEPLFKTLNLSRFAMRDSVRSLLPALERRLHSDRVGIYLEEVLSTIVAEGSMEIAPVFCDGIRWFEIDTPEDLATAEALFGKPKIGNVSGGQEC